jgi:hypothetical protein
VKTISLQISEWNDRMNPKFTDQEVADITTHLNAAYYKVR